MTDDLVTKVRAAALDDDGEDHECCDCAPELLQVLQETRARVAELEAQKDAAYAERNQCVAALARLALRLGWRAGTASHPAEDTAWEPDWRTLVFMDLPTGQVSWHLHDREAPLLEGLPRYGGPWDGHSTDEKYARLAALAAGKEGP